MSKSTSKKRIFFRKGSGLESIHQPHVRDYRETGRSKKRYQELLGLNFLDRQYQGKRILDFGSGPELLAPREIIREYLDAGLTPPHIVALSPAFFDDDIRTHALDKVRADGFEKYISVVAGYGHELPFSVKSFGLICAVHVF